jgi:hypothetical protein
VWKFLLFPFVFYQLVVLCLVGLCTLRGIPPQVACCISSPLNEKCVLRVLKKERNVLLAGG